MTPEYKRRRRLKHIAQNSPQVVLTDNISTGSTPDGLGLWKGGKQKSLTFGFKSRPTQFDSRKNLPGKASSGIVERSVDYFKQGYNTPVEPLKIEESDNIACDAGEPAVTPTEPGKGDFEQPEAL